MTRSSCQEGAVGDLERDELFGDACLSLALSCHALLCLPACTPVEVLSSVKAGYASNRFLHQLGVHSGLQVSCGW